MAKTYNRMNIEIGKPINSIGIHPVEGDTNSRYLDVSLYNNGVPINLTGERVRINFLKENGLSFFNQGEITDAAAGRCQFALTNEILSDAKAVKAQISIWNAGGEILSTEVFNILVSESIRNDEAVESENEFGVLVVLFQEIQNALDTMKHISDGFGEPGDKAAEYGVDTFWGILETLAQRGDVESVLEQKIKADLNSTVGTSDFNPLDKMLSQIIGGRQEFTSDGTFVVPDDITKIKITACGGGAGGEGGNGSYKYGGGGGGGADCVFKKEVIVTPRQSISITVGKGGRGYDRPTTTHAESGTSTVVGDLLTLAGGLAPVSLSVGGMAGGSGGGKGGDGYNGGTQSSTLQDGEDGLIGKGGKAGTGGNTSGGGGGGSLGDGGNGYTSNGELATNGGYGAGGGGGSNNTSSSIVYNGGNGGDGIVIIEWGLAAL